MIYTDLGGFVAHTLTPEMAHRISTQRKWQMRLVHYVVADSGVWCPDLKLSAEDIDSLDGLVSAAYNACANNAHIEAAESDAWDQLKDGTFGGRRRVEGCLLTAVVVRLPQFKGWS